MSIDAIGITIPQSDFKVTNHRAFSPDATFLMTSSYVELGRGGSTKCVQNPSKKEMKSGIYKPRLSLERFKIAGGQSIQLRIEFSIPKLLFGNNFEEVNNLDFPAVVDKLIKAVATMGIETGFNSIAYAVVSKIHYSKNIVFRDATPVPFIIKSIEKADISKRLDKVKTTYHNDGEILHYHSNSFQLTFYDKLKDLQTGKKATNEPWKKTMRCNLTGLIN